MTDHDLEQRLARLTPAQRERFERRLRGDGGSAAPAAVATLERADRDAGPYPLSFAQQRLWFLEQVTPGNPSYVIPQAFRLIGPLRLTALRRTVQALVDRHASLRTAFVASMGEPQQVVASPHHVSLPLVDLTALPAPMRERAASSITRADALRPFVLSAPSLFRSAVLRLGRHDHVWLMAMHHIVADAWSIAILLREASALYSAAVRGAPAALPTLATSYADHARWQRTALTPAVVDAQLAFWKTRLDDVAPLDLPLDRPRAAVADHAGAFIIHRCPDALAVALRAFSRRADATLYMTLLAAWHIVLARFSGQTDIAVGTPSANRTRAESAGVVGFFVNTLTVRVDLHGNPTLHDALARVRQAALEVYAHQDVPFELVVEHVQPKRDLSRNPMFQVEFQLHTVPAAGGLQLAELAGERFGDGAVTTRFDLEMHAYEQGDAIHLQLLYGTALFDRDSIARMLGAYLHVLRAMTEAPDTRIEDVDLLGPDERRLIVDQWNATAHEWPASEVDPLATLVLEQAEEVPDRLAAVHGGDHLTYAALIARASAIAVALRARQVGPDDRVGVCVERGLTAGVAVLGALHAGAAYVPLDPRYPAERRAFMVRDAELTALIAPPQHAVDLAPHALDAIDPERATAAAGVIPPAIVPADCLAYIIYTSGSTGVPKGVTLTRRALVNLLRWCAAAFPSAQRALQFASISFDASALDIFHTWASGGTLVWTDEDTTRDPAAVARLIEREAVERVMVPPSFLHPLTAALGESGRSLRDVIATGEPLRIGPEVHDWFGTHDCRLHNEYGPTESHVVTAFTCPREPGSWPATVPIGHAITNTQLYVLSRAGQPVPIGVVGELFIGGDCLARGYHRRPGLTADRFVPNPFGPRGSRLYRTGDRVKYTPSGDVEFLERADDQVKVRGYRIELGEVEAVLASVAGVAGCAVVAREDRGDRRLVAYVVASAASERTTTDRLRQALASRLPAFMVPSTFVMLPALPMTPNGKVDRRRLPIPDDLRPELDVELVAAQNPLQELLAHIYEELLGVDRVGIDDDFFDLGGHSLLATQLVTRARAATGHPVTVRDVFERPTVRGLADRLTLRDEEHPVDEPALVPAAHRADAPLSFAQQRLWFLEQLRPGTPVYNLPNAIRMTGTLDVSALRAALAAIVNRHDVLRTTFDDADGEPVQRVHDPADVALPIVDICAIDRDRRGPIQRRLVRDEAARPFDVTNGPLVRACLIRAATDEHDLVLTFHHLVFDGWSIAVLLRELSELYAAFHEGRSPTLSPLPIQYANYAVWQRAWLRDDRFAPQIAFWKAQLDGSPRVLNLPTEHPRPAVASYRGATETMMLHADLVSLARRRNREWGTTLFMTLLGCWQLLLWRHSGEADVLVGTPIAGRTRSELEPLIGVFLNMLVMRTRFSESRSFRDVVLGIREVALAAHAHQDVPFEQLVEELQPERDLNRPPLFQVQFVLQNAPRGTLTLPGLTLERVVEDIGVAKFDLTLAISDAGDAMAATIEYSTDLFTPDGVGRMLRQFAHALGHVLARPDASLREISVLTPDEEQRIRAWNATTHPLSEDRWVADWIDDSARAVPDRIAVSFRDEHVSYETLNQRAGRIAAALRRLGAAPERIVGVHLAPSADLVIAVLAVLKSGAAYLALEAELLPDRLRFMIGDAAAVAVVTTRAAAVRLTDDPTPILYVDDVAADEAANTSNVPVLADHAAYVIYTSGTTGRPKGVVSIHRGLLNRLVWMQSVYALTPDDVVLHKTPLGFDVSVCELLWPLMMGSRMAVIEPGGHRDPKSLADLMRRSGTTVAHFVPSMLSVYLEYAEPPRVDSLRAVIVSGEALSPELHATATAALGPIVANFYGPTEVSIDATWWQGEVNPTRPVPIGSPIWNTTAYVVDGEGRLAPIGVPGELYLGGVGLARGYLGRPRLTAAAFVPDPFAEIGGARLYRTGDITRHRSDGTLDYLGRSDQQVKVRGCRVELGEIERCLLDCPDVGAAAVIAHTAGGTVDLIAYVTRSGDAEIPPAQLRAWLEARLPSYMMPAATIWLDAMPVTSNGKADRQALSRRVPVLTAPATAARPPMDAIELELSRIWSEVLRRRIVDTRQSFFDLGGQSLAAVRVAGQIARHLHVDVPVESLFIAPTIESLARLLRERQGEAKLWRPIVAIQPHGTRPPLFCMPPIGFSIASYRVLAEHLGADQPVLACQGRPLHEWDDAAGVTLSDLARDNLDAIRAMQPHGPYRLAGWSSGGVLAFEMAQQLLRAGERVHLLTLFDSWAPGSRRPLEEHELLAMIVRAMTINAGRELVLDLPRLRDRPRERMLEYAVGEMMANGLGDGADQATIARAVNGLCGLQRLPSRYEAERYDGPMLLFRAAELTPAERRELEAEGLHATHPILRYRGWDRWTLAPPDVCDVPAVHLQIILEPHATFVADRLAAALRDDETSHSGQLRLVHVQPVSAGGLDHR